MTQRDLSFGLILAEAGTLASREGRLIGLLAAGYVAAGLLSDLYSPQFSSLLIGILGFFLGYEVLYRALHDRSEQVGRRYGSYLGVGLLSGLGIAVGLVFLLLPGIYLAARWSVSSAFVIAEGATAGQALGESWDATNGKVLPITLALILLWVPTIGLVVLTGLWSDPLAGESVTVIGAAIQNVLSAIVSFGGWILAAAIYRLLRGEQGYESVFA